MARISWVAVARWELVFGCSALAVPVFGPGGRVAAAIEVRVDDTAAELPTVRPALVIAGVGHPHIGRSHIGRRRANPVGTKQSMSSGRRRGHYDMTIETLQASTIIAAPAEAVFAVLADPASHPAIDGTAGSARHSTPRH